MLLHLACAIVEIALYLALLLASVHLARAAWWALARGPLGPELPDDETPSARFVTVQLPLRNEPLVAEGALRAAAALRWPKERLEIQVLDDSDDETIGIVDRVAGELRAEGVSIEALRRGSREGFKAGALAHGLARARGEYILVLDADFRPEPSFLASLARRLTSDQALAFVQARWSFRNEAANLLTRAQAAILDALFTIEQAELSARAAPVQFNGTGGLWRRDAIVRAGGWATSDDALTEDLDLSFRAHEVGLRGITIPGLAVSTELPESVASFVAQQARWVRGGGLGLRAIGRRLVARAALEDARTMLAHLARHARQPLFIAAIVRLVLVASFGVRSICAAWVGPAMIGATVLASGAYLGAAARRLGLGFAARAALAPALAALSVGLAPALSLAFVGGVLGRTGGGFARTEKRGEAAPRRKRSSKWSVARGLSLLLALGSTAALLIFFRAGDLTGVTAAALCAIGCAWMSF